MTCKCSNLTDYTLTNSFKEKKYVRVEWVDTWVAFESLSAELLSRIHIMFFKNEKNVEKTVKGFEKIAVEKLMYERGKTLETYGLNE